MKLICFDDFRLGVLKDTDKAVNIRQIPHRARGR